MRANRKIRRPLAAGYVQAGGRLFSHEGRRKKAVGREVMT